ICWRGAGRRDLNRQVASHRVRYPATPQHQTSIFFARKDTSAMIRVGALLLGGKLTRQIPHRAHTFPLNSQALARPRLSLDPTSLVGRRNYQPDTLPPLLPCSCLAPFREELLRPSG